ncbi:succinate dehydrogenase, hydrophobic membrane anchor protein [uncultured Ferrovibrio sp.]|jgi:succinate dehydrogenase / fumarate reductase membrane anchor subunit|uniref:succinate dehydrogenase, hydrophobic membrane anchor protein n=1 Tax=uncultured Ferrovibrio sp. TaxID=1576913 RepID=UPI002613B99D|nr:succinate dehydrogenase, hydrophobic membrane anchor protein [uncultured Ferrovibrio sp.]
MMSKTVKSMRTPLGRVRGLGSAKEGVQHWWLQRVTAVALVPLMLLLACAIIKLAGSDHTALAETFQNPFFAIIVLLAVLAAFWHLKLGAQVIIEDYIHSEGAKVATLLAVTFAIYLVGGIAAISVLKLFFGA